MDDQRDLISNHEQLPMLSQRPGAPESKCSRGALYTGFSVLVALLLAGQATTAYFLYQQQGRLDKLTVTSQNLQLENLRMKLPKPAKPLSQMRMATPMLMHALPMEGMLQGPMQNATKYGNTTLDHVMHLLLKADPLKVYPQLKGTFPENLKKLKRTMEGLDWKVFESWMHQWLLFEMSKNSPEKLTEGSPKVLTKCLEEASRIPAVHLGRFKPQCDENGNYLPLQCYGSIGYCWCVYPNGTEVPNTRSRGHPHHNCSDPLDMEDLSSGLGVTKPELTQAMA
ncbi:HLA class II histocompatibility antigen gamma chain isoform X2 [Desmodus rotundus]|uniref:HLA class II histocompatibility antigen gamma chain isoform X2 n=1 Tax=Desmodus rotundus TaxID=9430 RepID=UPI002381554C|nr:HLA class II histocompatibility antigen gamma chain isoform X2 [Desmodus rotundus]